MLKTGLLAHKQLVLSWYAPVAGAIAVWPNDGGGYGHVTYDTSASGSNSIQVMESNYALVTCQSVTTVVHLINIFLHGGSVLYLPIMNTKSDSIFSNPFIYGKMSLLCGTDFS